MDSGIIRVGIAGWTYEPWRGTFYPKGLRRELELEYAASQFRSIEVNATFYGLQKPAVFEQWADQVPADFVFAIKAPRTITHILRLRDPLLPLAAFIASGPLRLGMNLGPILWQFPPNFRFDIGRIEAFLRLLPHDTDAAAALCAKHGHRLQAPAWPEAGLKRPVRHAFEIRHESFCCDAFIDLLRAHNVALVCVDSVGWPRLMDVTADFVYCRLHGTEELYTSGYDNAALDIWVRRMRAWARGDEPEDAERAGGKAKPRKRDVFVFFDNDRKVRAPANALELMRRLRT